MPSIHVVRDLLFLAVQGKENAQIQEENIAAGKVYGRLYYKKNISYRGGVLLVGGFTGSRFSFHTLAQMFAADDYFSLSIDLPSHFLNPRMFTMGELSEAIRDGIRILLKDFGLKKIAVISHSMGAVGALYANAGYTSRVEKDMQEVWEMVTHVSEKREELMNEKHPRVHDLISEYKKINEEFEQAYLLLKQIIIRALKESIFELQAVKCHVFMAPPPECKKAFPGLSLLKNSHNPLVKMARKGLNAQHGTMKYVGDFTIPDVGEFLDYFLTMKEPIDFLTLIEKMAAFKRKDGTLNFLEKYQKNILSRKPKLFVYGKKDILLRPFFFVSRQRLERFYKSCGNAAVITGNLDHNIIDVRHTSSVNPGLSYEAVKASRFLTRGQGGITTTAGDLIPEIDIIKSIMDFVEKEV